MIFVLQRKQMLCAYVVLYCIFSAIGSLDVGFFDETGLVGYLNHCADNDFDEDGICPLTADNNYLSVKLYNGTCVELNDTDSSVFITKNNKDLGHSYKGGYAIKCETHNVSLVCPNGTFAKEIEWDTLFDVTYGIKLSCYGPEFYKSNGTVLESHPGSQFKESSKRKCAAIYGITFIVHDFKDAIVKIDLKKNCTVGYAKGIRWSCDPETVLSAIHVEIEDQTNYIKSATINCTEIPDIASLCEPTEEKQTLLSYNGKTSTTFSLQKKFGVGTALVMSDLNRNEYNFYTTSGFQIDKSIPKLSENFKQNLGQSNDTDFDWGASQHNMWQTVQSTALKIKTEPGCITEVFEIVGRCSFLEVRSTECVQVNICNGIRNETIVAIPDDIVNLSYRRAAVDSKKIHKHKGGVEGNHTVKVVAKPLSFNYIRQSFEKMLRKASWFNK